MKVVQSEPRRLSALCSLLGYSRQAYYQGNQESEKEALQEELILQEVMHIRSRQKRLGTRKMRHLMQDFMSNHKIDMGRDAFFNLLRKNHLLIRKRRRSKPKTTDSSGWNRQYPNLAGGFIPVRPNQLWVSDITYVNLYDDFAYLSLITDAYSRKIVGFYLCPSLSSYGCIQSLKMALKNNPLREGLIHHSDRGCQYRSQFYIKLLRKVLISMTQSGDPLENPLAERLNGILKQELLEEQYPNFKEAQKAIAFAINIYNNERPHSSIDMLCPSQAHSLQGELKKHWKNYYQLKKEVVNEI